MGVFGCCNFFSIINDYSKAAVWACSSFLFSLSCQQTSTFAANNDYEGRHKPHASENLFHTPINKASAKGEPMSTGEKSKTKSRLSLMQLAILYFRKKGYKVEREMTTREGYSGISRKFDLIVQRGRLAQGVWVRDWKRTIGVNIVINLDKASEDVGLSNPIIIGENFSDHAKSYANRRKITLLTKRRISMSLR